MRITGPCAVQAHNSLKRKDVCARTVQRQILDAAWIRIGINSTMSNAGFALGSLLNFAIEPKEEMRIG
jgi:hypothetical protein